MNPEPFTSMVARSWRLRNGYGTNFEMRAGSETFTVTLTSDFFGVQQWLEHTIEAVSNELGEDERMIVGLAVQRNADSNAAATLQVCIGGSVLMIQLAVAERVPTILRTLLDTDLCDLVCLDRPQEIAASLMACRHGLELRSRIIYIRDYFWPEHRHDTVPVIMERHLDVQGYILVNQPHVWDGVNLTHEQITMATASPFVVSVIAVNVIQTHAIAAQALAYAALANAAPAA